MSTLLTGSTFLNWLAPTRQGDIINTTWYRGDYWTGGDYETNLSSTANLFTGKVGLIRIGEMLASQSLSLLTNNYSSTNSTSNSKTYWTLTPYDASIAWHVFNNDTANSYDASSSGGVRAVIVIPSSMQITSGNGTLSSPYQV